MKLVVDTNILFSFFRENPVRDIIITCNSRGLELYSPIYAIDELRDNKQDILKYSGLKTNEDFEFVIFLLNLFIDVKPMDFFIEFKEEGIRASPDVKDAPFFALALKLKADIWSNEPRLKRQKSIKVLSTRDLLDKVSFKT